MFDIYDKMSDDSSDEESLKGAVGGVPRKRHSTKTNYYNTNEFDYFNFPEVSDEDTEEEVEWYNNYSRQRSNRSLELINQDLEESINPCTNQEPVLMPDESAGIYSESTQEKSEKILDFINQTLQHVKEMYYTKKCFEDYPSTDFDRIIEAGEEACPTYLTCLPNKMRSLSFDIPGLDHTLLETTQKKACTTFDGHRPDRRMSRSVKRKNKLDLMEYINTPDGQDPLWEKKLWEISQDMQKARTREDFALIFWRLRNVLIEQLVKEKVLTCSTKLDESKEDKNKSETTFTENNESDPVPEPDVIYLEKNWYIENSDAITDHINTMEAAFYDLVKVQNPREFQAIKKIPEYEEEYSSLSSFDWEDSDDNKDNKLEIESGSEPEEPEELEVPKNVEEQQDDLGNPPPTLIPFHGNPQETESEMPLDSSTKPKPEEGPIAKYAVKALMKIMSFVDKQSYNSAEEFESTSEFITWDAAVNVKEKMKQAGSTLKVGSTPFIRELRSKFNVRGFSMESAKSVTVLENDPLVIAIPTVPCPKSSFHFSKQNPWFPEFFVSILIDFLMNKKQDKNMTPILLTEPEALEFVNNLWKVDLEERKINPDDPAFINLLEHEKKTFVDSIVLLILLKHDFIASNKLLDLFKYIPEVPGWFTVLKREVFFRMEKRRKILVFPISDPKQDLDKEAIIEQVSKPETLKKLINETLEILKDIDNDIRIVTRKPRWRYIKQYNHPDNTSLTQTVS